jgi:2,3-bisphosphoglycerate-dependent phosphoglycerate mutase
LLLSRVTKIFFLFFSFLNSLQGYNKDTAYRELGLDQELVMQMRRSYDVRPPRMDDDHPYWHGNDRRYKKLSREQLERSRAESLKDTADRIMPFYESVIASALRSGNKCLVVSHANTIRTFIKNIDGISDEDIKGMSIPVSQNNLLLGTCGLCLGYCSFSSSISHFF